MRNFVCFFAGVLSVFSLSTQCEAFLGGVSRGPPTLKVRGCSVTSGKTTLSCISSRLSASKERTQEPKKMVTADDLKSCQVRVLGYRVRFRVSNVSRLSS